MTCFWAQSTLLQTSRLSQLYIWSSKKISQKTLAFHTFPRPSEQWPTEAGWGGEGADGTIALGCRLGQEAMVPPVFGPSTGLAGCMFLYLLRPVAGVPGCSFPRGSGMGQERGPAPCSYRPWGRQAMQALAPGHRRPGMPLHRSNKNTSTVPRPI